MSRRFLVLILLASASACARKPEARVSPVAVQSKLTPKDCAAIFRKSSEPVFVVDGVVLSNGTDSLSLAARDSARITCAGQRY
jgi:hypothetical protein